MIISRNSCKHNWVFTYTIKRTTGDIDRTNSGRILGIIHLCLDVTSEGTWVNINCTTGSVDIERIVIGSIGTTVNGQRTHLTHSEASAINLLCIGSSLRERTVVYFYGSITKFQTATELRQNRTLIQYQRTTYRFQTKTTRTIVLERYIVASQMTAFLTQTTPATTIMGLVRQSINSTVFDNNRSVCYLDSTVAIRIRRISNRKRLIVQIQRQVLGNQDSFLLGDILNQLNSLTGLSSLNSRSQIIILNIRLNNHCHFAIIFPLSD